MMYTNNFKRMRPWFKIKMWTDKGIMKKHDGYDLFQLANPYNIMIGSENLSKKNDRGRLLQKFMGKYPEVYLTMPNESSINIGYGTFNSIPDRFVNLQLNYMKQGFNEEKAFELVERDMSENLQQEKFERGLFEGTTISNRTRSLMNVYEQMAEFEAVQKVNRLERELPGFVRQEQDLQENLRKVLAEQEATGASTKERVSADNLYEPVSYMTSNMKREQNDQAIRESFVNRSEKILNYFQSLAETKHNLSYLDDKEFILKIKETPQKLKDHLRTLSKKLDKYNIKLNKDGKIDYNDLKDKNILNFVLKNQRLINICLLCKDLDFEIPHKSFQEDIRRSIEYEIQLEEQKLKNLENSKISFENWKKTVKTNLEFDNEFLEEKYQYLETLEEKEERLRKIWINSKKNLIDSKTFEKNKNFLKINKEIIELIKSLRIKIDQNLLKNKKHPVFGTNYRHVSFDEFMVDADIEFHKIKKFLLKSPEVLKNDPEIGFKYQSLVENLKRKVLIEKSSPKFGL